MPAPRTVPADLNELVTEALGLYRGLFQELRIDVRPAPALPPCAWTRSSSGACHSTWWTMRSSDDERAGGRRRKGASSRWTRNTTRRQASCAW